MIDVLLDFRGHADPLQVGERGCHAAVSPGEVVGQDRLLEKQWNNLDGVVADELRVRIHCGSDLFRSQLIAEGFPDSRDDAVQRTVIILGAVRNVDHAEKVSCGLGREKLPKIYRNTDDDRALSLLHGHSVHNGGNVHRGQKNADGGVVLMGEFHHGFGGDNSLQQMIALVFILLSFQLIGFHRGHLLQLRALHLLVIMGKCIGGLLG